MGVVALNTPSKPGCDFIPIYICLPSEALRVTEYLVKKAFFQNENSQQ